MGLPMLRKALPPVFALTWLLPLAALAQPVRAGTDTHGGAVAGAQIIHVTSLADSGLGSLRAAVQTTGARVVVFDVAGVIVLASDLKLSIPDLTIAGQTAPSFGITLTGASLRVRTHDVIIQHIAVRPGPGGSASSINGNRDSITIGGGTSAAYNVRAENMSLSWSVDENADITSPTTHNIILRNSIIAEALRNAGHPDGNHSMGMLINDDAQAVAVTGNLFVSNVFRNPVMARGVSAFVGYNYLVNPAENAIHFYSERGQNTLKASVIGNVIATGRDTDSNVTAVQIPADMGSVSPDALIYLSGNVAAPGALTSAGAFKLAATLPVTLAQTLQAPSNVKTWVLQYAGKKPTARDPVDTRVVQQAASLTTKVIDDPSQVGGLTATPPVTRVALVPASPFSPSGLDGLLRIETWLCQRHLENGGPNTPQCPRTVAQYRDALRH